MKSWCFFGSPFRLSNFLVADLPLLWRISERVREDYSSPPRASSLSFLNKLTKDESRGTLTAWKYQGGNGYGLEPAK